MTPVRNLCAALIKPNCNCNSLFGIISIILMIFRLNCGDVADEQPLQDLIGSGIGRGSAKTGGMPALYVISKTKNNSRHR